MDRSAVAQYPPLGACCGVRGVDVGLSSCVQVLLVSLVTLIRALELVQSGPIACPNVSQADPKAHTDARGPTVKVSRGVCDVGRWVGRCVLLVAYAGAGGVRAAD